jgi:hypothetical protein
MPVTKAQFLRYVRVQKSGVTNMWDVRRVCQLSGLSRDTVMDIMKNYGRYAKRLEKSEMDAHVYVFQDQLKRMLK